MTPQQLGTIMDLIKVIGGALMAVGLLKISNEQLNLYITQGTAFGVALIGLVGIVGPMVRSIYVRTREGSIKLASRNLEPGEKIVVKDPDEAAKMPANVVSLLDERKY